MQNILNIKLEVKLQIYLNKTDKTDLQVTFLKNGTKSLPKFTSENLKNKQLEDGCLAGSHF